MQKIAYVHMQGVNRPNSGILAVFTLEQKRIQFGKMIDGKFVLNTRQTDKPIPVCILERNTWLPKCMQSDGGGSRGQKWISHKKSENVS